MCIRKPERGFTLVEVMTAVLILSVGMLGVAAMLTTSMKSDNYNARVREAEQLANQKIEELRGKTVDSSLTATTGNWPPSSITSYYCYYWTVGAPDTSRICQVEVIVGWPTSSDCKAGQVGKCDYRVRMIAFIPQQ